MNYGLGLINVNGTYYNPSQIIKFHEGDYKGDTTVIQTIKNESDFINKADCSPEKFAEAFVEATRTGQIIDIKA